VPVVLNMISIHESAVTDAAALAAAVKPRPRSGLGAFELVKVTTPASARVATRPCTDGSADGGVTLAALAAAGQAVKQQLISKQSVYMTRISANGGGALGPHPAREPV
jgi:hypothetical protein